MIFPEDTTIIASLLLGRLTNINASKYKIHLLVYPLKFLLIHKKKRFNCPQRINYIRNIKVEGNFKIGIKYRITRNFIITQCNAFGIKSYPSKTEENILYLAHSISV